MFEISKITHMTQVNTGKKVNIEVFAIYICVMRERKVT